VKAVADQKRRESRDLISHAPETGHRHPILQVSGLVRRRRFPPRPPELLPGGSSCPPRRPATLQVPGQGRCSGPPAGTSTGPSSVQLIPTRVLLEVLAQDPIWPRRMCQRQSRCYVHFHYPRQIGSGTRCKYRAFWEITFARVSFSAPRSDVTLDATAADRWLIGTAQSMLSSRGRRIKRQQPVRAKLHCSTISRVACRFRKPRPSFGTRRRAKHPAGIPANLFAPSAGTTRSSHNVGKQAKRASKPIAPTLIPACPSANRATPSPTNPSQIRIPRTGARINMHTAMRKAIDRHLLRDNTKNGLALGRSRRKERTTTFRIRLITDRQNRLAGARESDSMTLSGTKRAAFHRRTLLKTRDRRRGLRPEALGPAWLAAARTKFPPGRGGSELKAEAGEGSSDAVASEAPPLKIPDSASHKRNGRIEASLRKPACQRGSALHHARTVSPWTRRPQAGQDRPLHLTLASPAGNHRRPPIAAALPDPLEKQARLQRHRSA